LQSRIVSLRIHIVDASPDPAQYHLPLPPNCYDCECEGITRIETEPALSTSRSGRQNAEYHFGMIKTPPRRADARWPISRATSADTCLSLACATVSMSGSLCPPRHISSPIIRSITRTRRISFSVGFRVRGDRVGQRRRRPDNSDASSARMSSEIFSQATSRCSYSAPKS